MAPRRQGPGAIGIALFAMLHLLPPLLAAAQSHQDPNADACLYLDHAFSFCWKRRRRTDYTASAVAQCVCTVGGVPDPSVDSAVSSCTSYLKTSGQEGSVSAFYSSFNGYCSSYGQDVTNISVTPGSVTASGQTFGWRSCMAIIGRYGSCQRGGPDETITQPDVASCICHGPGGEFTTGFDDLLTPCYNWATTFQPNFATEVSDLFGFFASGALLPRVSMWLL
ncbi:hypothetical protein DRE_07340 [Drechslerella stenobrocha 248]|uniref:Cyanovirin-N domain-containing protein n=1 Tax=Drechslerella stenobrocha 248 TaxID=1043628 RepID=W7I4V8_9PEZI|nr:hypothetical protein DRE_07340 [Drechslerella stenobrocha 248]